MDTLANPRKPLISGKEQQRNIKKLAPSSGGAYFTEEALLFDAGGGLRRLWFWVLRLPGIGKRSQGLERKRDGEVGSQGASWGLTWKHSGVLWGNKIIRLQRYVQTQSYQAKYKT